MRLQKFFDAYMSVEHEISELVSNDYKDDKDVEYSKAVIDRRLLQAVGPELFCDWNTRYYE